MKKELFKRIISSLFLIPIVLIIIIKGSIIFNFFLLICLGISIYEWFKISKKKNLFLAGLLFLLFSFYSAYLLRNHFIYENVFNIVNEINLIVFLLITFICITTDIGGYVAGKLFGGPKLTKISPNKTYSGVFGSYLFSIIFSTFFINNVNFFYDYKISLSMNINLKIIIFSILISTISQIGDLTVSFYKRKSNIKDTGILIPGHGGILDRIDGMIFVYPCIYLILLTNIISI